MRSPLSRGLLAVLSLATLAIALPSHSQTTASTPPSAVPAEPAAAAAPDPDDDFQWLSLGATAQCRDGAYFHGKADARACIGHGGIRTWLPTHSLDLIR